MNGDLILISLNINTTLDEWHEYLDTFTLDEICVIWYDIFDKENRTLLRPYLHKRMVNKHYHRMGLIS